MSHCPHSAPLSRRAMLGSLGAASLASTSLGSTNLGSTNLGAAAAARPTSSTAAANHTLRATSDEPAAPPADPTPSGSQRGVSTPPQDHLLLATFDLVDDSALRNLPRLMRVWNAAVRRLTAGVAPLADPDPQLAQEPGDLTITVAFGSDLFEYPALAPHRPPWLQPLPRYAIDDLDESFTGGDIVVQVCSDNPVAASHALRVLAQSATSTLTVRSVQRGYRSSRTAAAGPQAHAFRNAFGQVDGTVQPDATSKEGQAAVWMHGPHTPSWLRGGTSLAVRRIAMDLQTWGQVPRREREVSMGRSLADGAPLSGGEVTTPTDFSARHENGELAIHGFAHIRLARAEDSSQRMLRRGYTYEDGHGLLERYGTGLVFIAYQADFDKQFLAVQNRLAEKDLLNEWTTTIGSTVAAVPRLPEPGSAYGAQLWETAGLND